MLTRASGRSSGGSMPTASAAVSRRAPSTHRRAPPGRRTRRGSSRRVPRAGGTAARPASRSSPIPSRAAAAATAGPATAAVAASTWATSAESCSSRTLVAAQSNPATIGDAVGDEDVASVELAVRDARVLQPSRPGPRRRRATPDRRHRDRGRTAPSRQDSPRRGPRPARCCRPPPPPGTRTPLSRASSATYASYSTCWRRVGNRVGGASRYARYRQARARSCDIGLVAAERGDPHRAVVDVGEEQRASQRLLGNGTDARRRYPEARERGLDHRDRRSALRRAERVVHRGRDAPPEDDGAEEVGRVAPAEVHGGQCEHDDEAAADPAGGACQVRARRR